MCRTDLQVACTKINNLRMQGGTYTTIELIQALKGIPYNGWLPTVMRANPGIAGIEVLDTGFKFDKYKSIYKEALQFLISEAKKCSDASKHKSITKRKFLDLFNKPLPKTPLQLDREVYARYIELYYEGRCADVVKLKKAYEAYLKIC